MKKVLHRPDKETYTSKTKSICEYTEPPEGNVDIYPSQLVFLPLMPLNMSARKSKVLKQKVKNWLLFEKVTPHSKGYRRRRSIRSTPVRGYQADSHFWPPTHSHSQILVPCSSIPMSATATVAAPASIWEGEEDIFQGARPSKRHWFVTSWLYRKIPIFFLISLKFVGCANWGQVNFFFFGGGVPPLAPPLSAMCGSNLVCAWLQICILSLQKLTSMHETNIQGIT